MLDVSLFGEVDRISPDAPVAVVRTTHTTYRPGGAANVAMNLAALGAQVTLVGVSGVDRESEQLQSAVVEAGVQTRIVKVAGRPTTVKLRIVGRGQPLLRVDTEDVSEHSKEDKAALLAQAIEMLASVQGVILSDYAKGALSPEFCQAVIQAARSRELPVLADSKQRDFSRFRGVTTICPNVLDLTDAVHRITGDIPAILHKAQQLIAALDLSFVCVTLAEEGIGLVTSNAVKIFPAEAKRVIDVIGAGDTVAAAMALSLASGFSPEQAVRLANVAAGIVVGKVGTSIVRRDELIAALMESNPTNFCSKQMTMDALQEQMLLWRANGERVVFTNGCFDLLHAGHITLLEEARQQGQRLIVAINSDASVRAMKGPGRPLISADDRSRLLAALSAVDAVIVFCELTPLNMITTLRPDVLVKGGDYTEETVIGAPEVREWGGQVHIVPLVEGVSTTRLITQAAEPQPPT
jgi:D-beta-D-heptose 7-phosphate kinase/D-beta-D-heptose 1-phosphate adenosyltransferase